jgi:hypothetical protein
LDFCLYQEGLDPEQANQYADWRFEKLGIPDKLTNPRPIEGENKITVAFIM